MRPTIGPVELRVGARGAGVPVVAVAVLGVVVGVVGGGGPVGGGVAGVALGVLGFAAGAAARVLLARLRRGARVPPPWCEVAAGVLWAASGTAWGLGALPSPWLPVLLGLGWLAVAAGAVDVRHHRLPDALTLPALPAALLLLLPVGPGAVLHGAAGAAVAAAAHAAVHLVEPRAMGAGDVKLAAPLGAVLAAAAAWPGLLAAAVLAALLTAVAGGIRWAGRDAAVPHGPSMLAAAWLVTGWSIVAGAGATAAPT